MGGHISHARPEVTEKLVETFEITLPGANVQGSAAGGAIWQIGARFCRCCCCCCCCVVEVVGDVIVVVVVVGGGGVCCWC